MLIGARHCAKCLCQRIIFTKIIKVIKNQVAVLSTGLMHFGHSADSVDQSRSHWFCLFSNSKLFMSFRSQDILLNIYKSIRIINHYHHISVIHLNSSGKICISLFWQHPILVITSTHNIFRKIKLQTCCQQLKWNFNKRLLHRKLLTTAKTTYIWCDYTS